MSRNITSFPIPTRDITASDVPFSSDDLESTNVNDAIEEVNDRFDDYRTITSQDIIDNAQSTSITNLQTAVGQNINQWDEMWELGAYSSTGQKIVWVNSIRCANFIEVKPNTTYYFHCGSVIVCEFNSNKGFISRSAGVSGNYTTGNTTNYIVFECPDAYGTTYNHDISINYPSSFTGYYPSGLPKTNAHIGGLGNVIGMRGWNQLVKNGNFASLDRWISTFNCSASVSNNELTLTCTTSGVINIKQVVPKILQNHKYYLRCYAKTNASNVQFGLTIAGGNSSQFGQTSDIGSSYSLVESITDNTRAQDFEILYLQSGGSTNLSVGQTITVKNVMCIDLTALFGSGNEPTTVAEFRTMFPADYYPYSPLEESGAGYKKCADGTLICWGNFGYIQVGTTVKETIHDFPKQFSANPYVALGLTDGDGCSFEHRYAITSSSTSGFHTQTWFNYAGTDGITMDWIAIGRWY